MSQKQAIREARNIIDEVELDQSHDKGAPRGEVQDALRDLQDRDPEKLLESMRKKGEIHEPTTGHYRTT